MEGQSEFGVESLMDSSVLSTPDPSPEGWREELAWVWENGQVIMSRDRETLQGMQQPRVSCVVLTLGTLQWSIRTAVRINKRLNETASKTSSNAHIGEGSSGDCDERHFCPH